MVALPAPGLPTGLPASGTTAKPGTVSPAPPLRRWSRAAGGRVNRGPTGVRPLVAQAALSAPEPPLDLRGSPLLADLPDWAPQWRASQRSATGAALEAYKNGKRVFILQLPTGGGKSLIGEALRRLLRQEATYSVFTKHLQRQLISPEQGFPNARLIQGRANYPSPEEYLQAREEARASNLAILNYPYMLTESNLGSRSFIDRGFGIADECCEIDPAILAQTEFRIPVSLQDELGMEPPRLKGSAAAWREWLATEASVKLGNALGAWRRPDPADPDAEERWAKWRQLSRLKKLAGLLERQVTEGQWVYDGPKAGQQQDPSPIVLRPVYVQKSGSSLLWQHSDLWLLMSATVISPEQLASDLGLPQGSWAFHDVPSAFDVDRWPIEVVPVANMTHKTTEQELPKLAKATAAILQHYHPGERVLVHTVSYGLTRALAVALMRLGVAGRIVVCAEPSDRAAALERYREQPDAVLLAPSFTRGVSLENDLCRGVIVAKTPFASLGDKVTAARLYAGGTLPGSQWYAIKTIRELVQATGRGMRHETDYCRTWLLDAQFPRFYGQWQPLFPAWWKRALQWQGFWSPIFSALAL